MPYSPGAVLVALIVASLAAYRITQLIVHDSIADRPRLVLFARNERHPDRWATGFLASLVSCTYCAGWWVSMVVTVAVLTAVEGWTADFLTLTGYAVFAWSVAGGQALLNRYDDMKGA